MLNLLWMFLVMFGGAPVDDAVVTERLERMLEEGDERWIGQTFRRHPGHVLPFVDGYLEGGLAMIEKGASEADARASFRRGLAFATIASAAFDDPIFEDYAASFGSWSPQEQKHFRRGQAEYRLGRGAEADPAAAETHFRASYDLAAQLEDAWGMAMASGGLARMLHERGDRDGALRAAGRSIELYRRLRLTGGEADALVVLAGIQGSTHTREALVSLQRAWSLVEHRGPEDTRLRRVLDAYTAALDRAGQRNEATALRERIDAKMTPAADPNP